MRCGQGQLLALLLVASDVVRCMGALQMLVGDGEDDRNGGVGSPDSGSDEGSLDEDEQVVDSWGMAVVPPDYGDLSSNEWVTVEASCWMSGGPGLAPGSGARAKVSENQVNDLGMFPVDVVGACIS